MKEEIKDKTMDIISKYNDMPDEYKENGEPHTKHGWLLNELTNLIKQERKDAIEGFVNWFEEKTAYGEWDMPNMDGMPEEYLNSLDEKL